MTARVCPRSACADVYAKIERARRKIEDESGRPLEEWEYQEAAADLVLSLRDDGTIEGKTRSAESCYCAVVHADTNSVETEDGDLPISPKTAELIACEK
jgi:hypothetical protein